MADWTPVDLLPGLWLGLLGCLLAAALRRWFDPLPGWVLAVFAAVLLILFTPVLFGGRVLLPLDDLRTGFPFQLRSDPRQADLIELVAPPQAAAREALTRGRWPLWNRRAGAGMPLLADPQSQALQPLTLLGLPLPVARAIGFVAALRVLMALVFGFLALRRLGLRPGLALTGALAWGIGGLLFLGVEGTLASFVALLPFLFYAVIRCGDPGGRRDAFLLALALLCLLLDGRPEMIAGALGLALLVFLDRLRRRPAGLRRALLVRAGTALVVAGMVAAPLLLPTLRYLPKTVRGWRHFKLHRGASPFATTANRRLDLPYTASLSAIEFGLGTHRQRAYRMAALGDDFPPNLATLYKLEDARIYSPTAPKDYLDFMAPLVAGRQGEVPELGAPAHPLYQQLGVRYLLTPLDTQLPAPWKRLFTDRTAAVWEQSEAYPLLFLATDRPTGAVLIRKLEDTRISAPVSLRDPRWLGTRLFQDGGWVVLVNGLPRATTGYTFVTARLTPGPPETMQLDLLYRPVEFVWGLVAAALGLAAGAAAWLPRPKTLITPALFSRPLPPPSPGEEGERTRTGRDGYGRSRTGGGALFLPLSR